MIEIFSVEVLRAVVDSMLLSRNDQEIIKVLMQIVPGFSIIAALYLATIRRKSDDVGSFELSQYKFSRTIYALLFGVFGGSAYMILNEHRYDWYPLFLNEDEWLIVALVTLLAIEVTLFYIVIVTQHLEWPWHRARQGLNWLCEKIRLKRVARSIRREDQEREEEEEKNQK